MLAVKGRDQLLQPRLTQRPIRHGTGKFEALVGIPQISSAHQALGVEWHVLSAQPFSSLGFQLGVHGLDAGKIVVWPFLITCLHIIVLEVSAQQAIGRQHTGGERHDDGRNI